MKILLMIGVALCFATGLAAQNYLPGGQANQNVYDKGVRSVDGALVLPLSDTTAVNAIFSTRQAWRKQGAVALQGGELWRFLNGSWAKAVVPAVGSNGGTVTSIGIQMPAAFSVSPSAITTNGTFNISATGNSSQYIKGDGGLATFPTILTPTAADARYTITGSLVKSSSNAQTLAWGNDYVFTGATAVFTLPSVSPSLIGRANAITIKNRGSGNITVNTNGGVNVLYGNSLTNSFIITSGEAYTLINDGTIINIE